MSINLVFVYPEPFHRVTLFIVGASISIVSSISNTVRVNSFVVVSAHTVNVAVNVTVAFPLPAVGLVTTHVLLTTSVLLELQVTLASFCVVTNVKLLVTLSKSPSIVKLLFAVSNFSASGVVSAASHSSISMLTILTEPRSTSTVTKVVPPPELFRVTT